MTSARPTARTADPVSPTDLISRFYAEQNRWWAGVDGGIKRAARDLIKGAIDMHLHCDPSHALRLMDAFQAAEQASASGMRAIVLKDHFVAMEDAAWLVRDNAKLSPPFEVFGSSWMNNHVGGWNVFAVDKAILFGARVIGGPTLSSLADTTRDTPGPIDALVKWNTRKQEPVYTLDARGEVRPEVLECLSRIAEAEHVVFATGHLDKRETFAVVRAARQRGIRAICLTHVTLSTDATLDELRELCSETGAVAEFTVYAVLMKRHSMPEMMRAIGLDHVTLSTDAGISLGPGGVDVLQYEIAGLLEAGMTEDEVITISRNTPSRLLGIKTA